MKLRQLLTNGYFPRELPPPFNTRDFATFIARSKKATRDVFLTDKPATKCAKHNLPRSGTLRRSLRIPNPVSFLQLAPCM